MKKGKHLVVSTITIEHYFLAKDIFDDDDDDDEGNSPNFTDSQAMIKDTFNYLHLHCFKYMNYY